MAERQITSIVWHQVGHYIDIVFVTGDPDRLEGPHELAAELAADSGLTLLPTRDGTVRWVKPNPDGWWSS